MLDKLLLNNQIVTNKGKILRARVQTINKLVQKIRKLKVLNEKKPNNVKITENLEKTPKIMACVKKLKAADIIRKILILSKKPAAILTNGQAPPEDIAVALLANNKFIVNIISTLRTLLHLDDNNPGWKDEIMEISKRKKKLLQSDERKKTRKIEKRTKKPTTNKIPWNEENLHKTDSNELINNDEVAISKGWKVEPIEEHETSKKPKQELSKKVEKKEIIEKDKRVVEKEIKSSKVDENPLPKTRNLKPVTVEKEIKSSNVDENPLPKTRNLKPVKTVDSFFFTETGDNYLSTVVIDRVQPEAPDDGLVRRERRDNTMRPYQKNSNNRRQSVQNGRIDKRQSFASLNAKPEVTEEKLHPSWAAKQKLKPSINKFMGQKITFDDDGESKSVAKTSEKDLHKPNYLDKNVGRVESQDNLHPSWAAKQKLKPTITEFKGTKITFDD